jgi:hypothetical protein
MALCVVATDLIESLVAEVIGGDGRKAGGILSLVGRGPPRSTDVRMNELLWLSCALICSRQQRRATLADTGLAANVWIPVGKRHFETAGPSCSARVPSKSAANVSGSTSSAPPD